MGLLLSGILKDQKWSLGAHFISKPLFERTRGEKGGGGGGRKARVCKEEWLWLDLLLISSSKGIKQPTRGDLKR